jgi:hypothetical protein
LLIKVGHNTPRFVLPRRISIKHLFAITLALFILLLHHASVYAEIEQLSDELPDLNPDAKDWQFEEDAYDLPAYPDFDKLQRVQIDASFGGMEFFIDPASLKIGRDEVVLVTTIITSRRGARNVLFEGYRCDSREHKTLAYGTSKNTFYEVPDSQWKSIRRSRGTNQDFRRELVTTYLCDIQRLPLPRDEILRLIKYPSFRDDEGRMF